MTNILLANFNVKNLSVRIERKNKYQLVNRKSASSEKRD